ncbi:aminotransferase class I/II-fold pyridoxal phosphate-dependent enzyme [Microbacterium amylolyticum]|uniref:Aminotransferase n=1 Tax=Microbacterium amylolyticum TaxID=936337 RepID=A0ABS4ZF19_9MICO|nr:aminotransferase class I/II-fold pyridoxal phosphate-dependent enzyme [Microbacterium amylolyticum]MBP2435593.1 aspartate/methionine/tyrosine aminotransferase [Microbacterium amylolyticum]
MQIAQRALDAEPFYAMSIGQRAAELQVQGIDVVRLSLGEPDFGAPHEVRGAMIEAMDGRPLPYTPAMGLPELREAISRFYVDRHSVVIAPSRIMVTSGASAALLVATAVTTNPGDEVVMADPSYPCNRELVKAFGGDVVAVPTTSKTRFQLNEALADGAWTERTTSVMVATPSNPTGTAIAAKDLADICRIARERGAWRIVDEIYLDLQDPDAAGLPAPSVLTIDPDAIVIGSFSKYFGMTGWRLGWVVLPDELTDAAERLAVNFFLCASAPAQLAAVQAFSPSALAACEQRREEFVRRRAIVIDGLERIGLPVAATPDGAFYAYCDVSSLGLDSETFCRQALEDHHVAITPGRDFGTATGATHVRISYAASEGDLREGLRRVGNLVGALRA